MRERGTRFLGFSLCALALLAAGMAGGRAADSEGGKNTANWPSFRGPNASGIGDAVTATTWSVPAGQGVRWRVEVPGLGHSSPIVWGDRIFVTTAISGREAPELKVGLYGEIAPVEDDTEHRYELLAYDLGTG